MPETVASPPVLAPEPVAPPAPSAALPAADFSLLRYAQCWEDADILLRALAIRPGDRCLSIASAGDNALALLTADPASVLAVDLSPAQLAACSLRIAACRTLDHGEFLELLGCRPSDRRADLYRRCRRDGGLPPDAAAYWDACPELIAAGVATVGKFERYFTLFRTRILPLVHSRATINDLLTPKTADARRAFYDSRWHTRRWRLLFALFFSRFVMGRLGRDPAFFQYVQGRVGTRIMARTRHALVRLDPAANPYARWIVTGDHGDNLPLPFRPEHYDAIRTRVDRIILQSGSITDAAAASPHPFDRFNLSDIFEYMPAETAAAALRTFVDAANPSARLVYWNMLVPRSAPPDLSARVRPLRDLARELHAQDKAFFYRRLVIEEVLGP